MERVATQHFNEELRAIQATLANFWARKAA